MVVRNTEYLGHNSKTVLTYKKYFLAFSVVENGGFLGEI